MALLQGNTYEIPIQIKDSNGEIVTPNDVNRVQFIFGDLEKFYEDGGVVTFDNETNCFVIPLTEEETFAMSGNIKWQVRVLYITNQIDGTKPKTENIYESITTTELTPQEEQQEEQAQQQQEETQEGE